MITIQAGHAIVVDDEPANRDFLERLMQMAGFKVTGAGSFAEAMTAVKAIPALALALVDQELPDATGIEVIQALRTDNPESLLIMATMHDHRELIDQAFEAGIDVFLVKPHGFMELYRRLQEVDSNTSLLRRIIIDQYGPRPYRGVKKQPATPAAPTVPATPATPTTPPATPPAPVAPRADAPVTPEQKTVPERQAAPTPTPTPTAPALEQPAATPAASKPLEPPAAPKTTPSVSSVPPPSPAPTATPPAKAPEQPAAPAASVPSAPKETEKPKPAVSQAAPPGSPSPAKPK